MGLDLDKNRILEESLEDLDQKINYSLVETRFDDREDLKQDILLRLIEAVDKMEVISYSDFRYWWNENNS